ncbi:hypothetical protein NWF32_09965 [Pseudomonas qingdaonensis]|nr:hypothetical protein [Pseudomonas qingdaonensis]
MDLPWIEGNRHTRLHAELGQRATQRACADVVGDTALGVSRSRHQHHPGTLAIVRLNIARRTARGNEIEGRSKAGA